MAKFRTYCLIEASADEGVDRVSKNCYIYSYFSFNYIIILHKGKSAKCFFYFLFTIFIRVLISYFFILFYFVSFISVLSFTRRGLSSRTTRAVIMRVHRAVFFFSLSLIYIYRLWMFMFVLYTVNI